MRDSAIGMTDGPVVRARVAVVILNWRAAEMTVRSVEQVLRQTIQPDTIYVVDNGSGDGSADYLRNAFATMDGNITLLVNADNLGFGGGCNTALAAAANGRHDFIWLLNNDAGPAPDCLEALLEAARRGPAPVGIVGSLLHDPMGHAHSHFGSWMNPVTLRCGSVDDAADLTTHRFAWLTAASMLVSTAALRVTGVFDPGFFMYWEDADLNMRIREAGFSLIVAPAARVEHSAGTSSATIPVQRYLWHFASQRRWLTKHHPHPHAAQLWLRAKYLIKAMADHDRARFLALLRA